jgi:nucleotidyltransferase/DNA polymerase involved in DNA repair
MERETGFKPRIGVGGSRFVAEVAARRAEIGDLVVVPQGNEGDFLSPLPVGQLPLPPEVVEKLELLGVKTIGQVASFPPGALEDQFGPWVKQVHDLARGIDPRPIIPRPKRESLYAEKGFDQTVQDQEALVMALASLLDKLLPSLQKRGRLCGMVEVRISLERGKGSLFSWHLKEPSASRDNILQSLRYRLDRLALEGPVSAVGLGLTALGGEQKKQSSLFPWKVNQPEAVRLAAARLREKFGRSPIQQMVAVEPSSHLPERRFALKEWGPP